MFELVAVDHLGVNVGEVMKIPLPEVRDPLLTWLDTGAQQPARLLRHGNVEFLRASQETLAFHGVMTEIRRAQDPRHATTGGSPVVYTPDVRRATSTGSARAVGTGAFQPVRSASGDFAHASARSASASGAFPPPTSGGHITPRADISNSRSSSGLYPVASGSGSASGLFPVARSATSAQRTAVRPVSSAPRSAGTGRFASAAARAGSGVYSLPTRQSGSAQIPTPQARAASGVQPLPPRQQSSAAHYTRPPTAPSGARAIPRASRTDSSVIQYRQMMRQMEERQTSASPLVSSFGWVRPWHIIVGLFVILFFARVASMMRAATG